MKTKAKSAKNRAARPNLKAKAVPSKEIKTIRTRTIPAGKFKAQCLAIIDEVHERREQVIITKYGKPMARLEPVKGQPQSLFGFMQGQGRIVGDIVSPVFPEDDWESER